jgi:hypothetical protein
MDIYLEIGKKRTFAGALDWPGWCRSGRDEAAALQALYDYRLRYAHAIDSARLGFEPPADLSTFRVIERLVGDSTTDFGAPSVPPSADAGPLSDTELQRLQALLESLWRSFEATARAAEGQELHKGPRGGGRDLESIIRHVQGAEAAYLNSLGGKVPAVVGIAGLWEGFEPLHQAILAALGQAARGELARVGPRGGPRWTPRYFVRRTAWHVLDHQWEIEDRLL